jgi:hypothetical protein
MGRRLMRASCGPHAAIGAALYEWAGAKRRRPQAAVADLVPLATRVALRGGIFGGLF